ncbi:MAG: flagellin, partial [Lachnospiraceae bacterium]|nr:flagellin [Lachnospiraceae bacterium]
MHINSNITALITNNSLLRNESAFSLSTGKLSSGYKINTAGDDPTGYAISGRMRQQLDALKRADVNATTGKSVLETADGALSEVTEMLQRLNELAIKASNGTMSASDRSDIQREVDQLTDEIQRISDQIELNGQKLLDGHLENHGYCET